MPLVILAYSGYPDDRESYLGLQLLGLGESTPRYAGHMPIP